MTRPTLLLTLALFITLAVAALGQRPSEQPQTFLSALSKGQSVILKESAGRYEISTIHGTAPLSHKVTEVGSDFLVVEDIAGATETRIPVYSIKSISKIRVPGM